MLPTEGIDTHFCISSKQKTTSTHAQVKHSTQHVTSLV